MRTLLLCAALGCTHSEDKTRVASFAIDAPAGSDAYVCTTIAAPSAPALSRIEWRIPTGAGVVVHHATLYAVRTADALTGERCATMPADAVSLHVYAPGSMAIDVPGGLQIPDGTAAFVIQAHVARTIAGSPLRGEVAFTTSEEARSVWRGIQAPVPALRPRHAETITWSCAISEATRLSVAWPHMHRLGRTITVARLRGTERLPLFSVRWDFDRQSLLPLDFSLASHERIEVRCDWENPTEAYVMPGIGAENEMCNVAFILSPAAEWVECL